MPAIRQKAVLPSPCSSRRRLTLLPTICPNGSLISQSVQNRPAGNVNYSLRFTRLASYEEKGRCRKMQSARHENMRNGSCRRPAISRDAGIALRGGGRASRGAGKDLRAGPASRSTSPNPHSASSDLRGADPNLRSASRTSHGKDPASHILDPRTLRLPRAARTICSCSTSMIRHPAAPFLPPPRLRRYRTSSAWRRRRARSPARSPRPTYC